MAPKPTSAQPTNSGIRQTSTGDSVIPSSTRADGTVRKEIRVKPGYKPPEDVEVYKNRTAEAWKNRGKGGVPGAEAVATGDNEVQSTAATKNAKRREARKRAAAAAQDNNVADDASNVQVEGNGDLSKASSDSVAAKAPLDPDVQKAKEARNLTKKLRQARELQEKKDKGGELLPDQFAKVIKINELIRQLDSLGFDAKGEPKGHEAENEAG